MRCLDRDRRTCWIARYEGMSQAVDSKGRLTGRNAPAYAAPKRFSPTVTAARGQADGDYFGVSVDYDRTLTVDDPDFPVKETDVLYIDSDPRADGARADYRIARIARTSGFTVMAAKRIEAAS